MATTSKNKKPVKTPKVNKRSEVEVKNIADVSAAINRFIYRNLHSRYGVRIPEATRMQIVSYGPWIATIVTVIALPQLLVLAQTGSFVSLSGFFSTVFFNQDSWMLLLVMLANVLLLVDGLSYIFNKLHRGWNRIYLASLTSTTYVLWQVIDNSQQRAAAVLSALLCFAVLFVILDVREYYK